MAINPMDLPDGARLRRKGEDAVLVVVGNPQDGMWLHVRPEADPAAAEELCFVEEVAEVLPGKGHAAGG